MKVSDLTVEVRDASLQRVGQLLAADLVGFEAVLRFNEVGSWKVTLPVGHRMASYLAAPGAGIIVTTDQGTLLSGPVTAVVTTQETGDPEGTLEVSGVDDSVLLQDRLAYPTPSTADLGAQTDEYDVRTGAAETVIKAYVDANMGPSAPAVRKIAGFMIQADQGRGTTVTAQARFEMLQELIKPLADVSGLGYTVEQNGDSLEFQVYQPLDRSAEVRLDLYNGRLSRTEYSFSVPVLTRTIVGGSGDGAARMFYEQTSSDSLTAEASWGRRVERFVDARDAADTVTLAQAGEEALANDGKTQVSVSISPSDDQTMLFGVDWFLGDKVTVVVGDLELSSVVTEVGLVIAADGVRIGATVGEPRTLDYETQLITRQANQAARISQLERNK